MTSDPATALLDPRVTLCADCRSADAELVVDVGERWARPVCFNCIEDVIERENALAISRDAVEQVDAARRDVTTRPPARPIVRDWESLDHTKLNALKRQWVAFGSKVSDLERCWAILPSGGRCGRRGGPEGVCETHVVVGCKLPGLGWREGQPIGRTIVRQGRSTRVED